MRSPVGLGHEANLDPAGSTIREGVLVSVGDQLVQDHSERDRLVEGQRNRLQPGLDLRRTRLHLVQVMQRLAQALDIIGQ